MPAEEALLRGVHFLYVMLFLRSGFHKKPYKDVYSIPSLALPSPSDLPYYLPVDPQGQLRELAKILNIPLPLAKAGGPLAADALSATILFRHLNQAQRQEALSSRELRGRLVTKAVDTTFVNPKWGVWSLTSDELMAEQSFHSALDNYATWAGFGLSGIAAKDFFKHFWKNRKVTRGGIATLVIWMAVARIKAL